MASFDINNMSTSQMVIFGVTCIFVFILKTLILCCCYYKCLKEAPTRKEVEISKAENESQNSQLQQPANDLNSPSK